MAKIIATRNRIIHGYATVDMEIEKILENLSSNRKVVSVRLRAVKRQKIAILICLSVFQNRLVYLNLSASGRVGKYLKRKVDLATEDCLSPYIRENVLRICK